MVATLLLEVFPHVSRIRIVSGMNLSFLREEGLVSSQKPATDFYLEPNECSQHRFTLFLVDTF
jgi:hypothetical protein